MEYISKKLILLLFITTFAGLFTSSCQSQVAFGKHDFGREYIGLIIADTMPGVITPRSGTVDNLRGGTKVLVSCRVTELIDLLKEYKPSRLAYGNIFYEILPANRSPSLVSLHCLLTV